MGVRENRFSPLPSGSKRCSLQWPPPLSKGTPAHQDKSNSQLSAALLPQDAGLPSLLTAFDTFNGASVDPVVVSDVFWSSLSTKLISLIAGQILATIVFSVAISVAASQLSGVLDRLSKGIVERLLGPPPPKLRMPPELSDRPAQQVDLQKLAICIAIDVLGTSSELLPIVGELTDIIYAPIAATLLRNLYGGSNVVFLLEFGEEILPFTDILPLATICWVVDTLAPQSGLARLLQLGDYRPGGMVDSNTSSDVVDTTSGIWEAEKKGEDRTFR